METLAAYLERLGSASPSPGGGSAAAVTAASGTALIEMVCRLNAARDKKKGLKTNLKAADKLKKTRLKLVALMKDDEKVFTRLSKLSRESREYQKALDACASVPYEMAELCVAAIEFVSPEIKKTSKWLISDLYEAELLLVAGLRSAKLNVKANLAVMKDSAKVKEYLAGLEGLERRMKKARLKILEATGA